MNKIIIAILFTIIGSCKMKNKTDEIKQKIIGEWFYVQDETDESYRDMNGYTFSPNNLVEVKLGFYKYIQVQGEENFERAGQFIGDKTKYRIDEDSLKIFLLPDSIWRSQKIISLSDDTLKLEGERVEVEKFVKYSSKLDIKFQFDKISLTSSGCYGSCPIMKINIFSDGDVQFYGNRFTTQKGYFTAKISPKKYIELSNNFRKVNLSKLPNDFQVGHTDDNTIIVSFWQGGKIVKTVRDYGRMSPCAFICAYTQLRNLYQQINLTQLDEKMGKQIFNDDFR